MFQVGAGRRLRRCGPGLPECQQQRADPPLRDGRGPLDPGATVSLGSLAAGTELGFFLVVDGASLNGWRRLPTAARSRPATFEVRRDGDQVTLLRDGDPVAGALFVTVNPDPADPQVNVLNPDGRTHVVSWYDSATGDLLFALEDLPMAGRPRRRRLQRRRVPPAFRPGRRAPAVLWRRGRGRHFQHRDRRRWRHPGRRRAAADGLRGGDRLELARTLDANGDGLVDGTAIRIVEATRQRFVLSGTGTIDQYEQALNSLRMGNEGEPTAGERLGLAGRDRRRRQSQRAGHDHGDDREPVDGGGRRRRPARRRRRASTRSPAAAATT